MRSPVNRHRLWQVAVDAALIAAAWVLSWYVRFDGDWPVYYDRYLEWDVVCPRGRDHAAGLHRLRLYNRWWRYVSTQDMWGVLRGGTVAVIAAFVVFAILDFHPRRFRAASGSSTCSSCSRSSWACAFSRGTIIERTVHGHDRRRAARRC
jgi:FlaA1/EpsC-like NDP-sugar epimerase